MRITTKALCWLSLAGLLALNSEALSAKAKAKADRDARKASVDAIVKAQKDEATALAKLSAVALERAKTCLPVIDPKTQKPITLVEGQEVTVSGTPIKLVRRVVCNWDGDTAYVGELGTVQEGSIAKAAAEDLATFREILKGGKTDAK